MCRICLGVWVGSDFHPGYKSLANLIYQDNNRRNILLTVKWIKFPFKLMVRVHVHVNCNALSRVCTLFSNCVGWRFRSFQFQWCATALFCDICIFPWIYNFVICIFHVTSTTVSHRAHQQIKLCWFMASLTTPSRNRQTWAKSAYSVIADVLNASVKII